MFRDSFYENFHQLFLDGCIDTTISPPAPGSNVKIRFSNYLPREKVIEHIEKLRTFYDVQMFPGIINFDAGEYKHTMSSDYDYVRLFLAEEIDLNKGYHVFHEVYTLGVLKDDLDLTDDNLDNDKLMNKIKQIIAKSENNQINDVITFE